MSLTDSSVEQVPLAELTHFDGDAVDLVKGYYEAGWSSRLTTKGHLFMLSPDGQETTSITRSSLRGRSGRNAAAALKRWNRGKEHTGAAFGIEPAEGPHESLYGDVLAAVKQRGISAKAVRDLRSDPRVQEWTANYLAKHPNTATVDVPCEFYFGDGAPDRWAFLDTTVTPPVVVAWGPGMTVDDAYEKFRQINPELFPREDKNMHEDTTCSECGMALNARALPLHIRNTHTGWICPECGEKLTSGRALANHRKSEHDVMPALQARKQTVCAWCGRDDFESALLRAGHERSHQGEPKPDTPPVWRPFACDYCDRKFEKAAHLGRHVTSTHKDEPAVAARYQAEVVRDVPVTSPVTPDPEPAPQAEPVLVEPTPAPAYMLDLPTGQDAEEIVAKIRAILSPPLVTEIDRLRTENAQLRADLEIAVKERGELDARMSILKEAMGL